MMYERVFILEASGPTLEMLRERADELPTFRRFLSAGASGTIRGPLQPTVPSAYGALATGKNPGRTGSLDYFAFPAGGYDRIPFGADRLREETLWARLSAHGRRVGLLNVPLTWPLPVVDGFVVCGDEGCGDDYASPPAVLDDLRRLGYSVPFGASCAPGRERQFLDHSLGVLDMRRRALKRLFEGNDWRFGMLTLHLVGEILHAFWRHHDARHPRHLPPGAIFGGRDPLREALRGLDGLLGEVVELCGANGLAIFLGAWSHRLEHSRIHWNALLEREGWLRFRTAARTRLKRLAYRLGITAATAERVAHRLNLYRLFHYKLKRGARSAIKGATFLSHDDIDWSRTKAVALGYQGQIWLNVRGERPRGAIDPESRAAERSRLASLIASVRDPRSGEPVVERVLTRDEAYAGPRTVDAPDLLIQCREGWSSDCGFSGGGKLVTASPPGHSSDHWNEGPILALGPEIRPGRIEARLEDVAPTVLAALGVPSAGDLDGKPLGFLP